MKQILYRLFEHQFLGRDEAKEILQNMVAGLYTEAQIASLITVFLMRSISVEELAGLRAAAGRCAAAGSVAGGLSIWDALIVEAAYEAGATLLYTEDAHLLRAVIGEAGALRPDEIFFHPGRDRSCGHRGR